MTTSPKAVTREEMERHFQFLSWDCPNHDLDTGTRCPKCGAIRDLIIKYGPGEDCPRLAPKKVGREQKRCLVKGVAGVIVAGVIDGQTEPWVENKLDVFAEELGVEVEDK